MSDENYEIEERAAIREFDGHLSASDSEDFAADDIQQREKELTVEGIKNLIKELQEKREKIGKEIMALKESERKKVLFEQWMQINKRILDLRKELR